MAQVIKKSRALTKRYLKHKALSLLCYIACITLVLLLCCNFSYYNLYVIAALLLGFIICLLYGRFESHRADTVLSGIKGEKHTAKIISSLPKKYCGFQNLTITYKDKTSELDMVVVGPTGVFVIETKNVNGTVKGNYSSSEWTKKKLGRQKAYINSFYNPIKQVNSHVYRLANYLKSNGINVHINDIVYFSNPDTYIKLYGTPSQTPVFSANADGAANMCNYILNNEQYLSKNEISKIIVLLNR